MIQEMGVVLPAGLARAGGDLGEETTSVELGLDFLGEGAGGRTLVKLALDMVGNLGVLTILFREFNVSIY